MHAPPPTTGDGSNPLFWVLISGLLVGGLVLVSTILSSNPAKGRTVNRSAPGGGRDGSGVIVRAPGATVASPHATGLPDGPPVTIIQDVRRRLNRLPLDRNHPKGWTNRPVPT